MAPSPPNGDYGAWGRPSLQWIKWVAAMRSSHYATWQSAGIHDAIINSTYSIRRRGDLISSLAEKWSPATNTFVFRWGEATVTLEDLAALGGYSVGGGPASDPPPVEAQDKLSELFGARLELTASPGRRACLSKWMSKFMGSGSGVEHEAFLAYWLSKFVFPLLAKAIGKAVIPIAVRLGTGARVALAPPVLAYVYRALTVLRKGAAGPVKAPLSLVQVWAWERFPGLSPGPILGATGPRMARWDGRVGGRCTSIDFEGGDFAWQPYGVDVERFDVLELVGLERGFVEWYRPHRVARQLGMDRDRELVGPDGDAVMDQDLVTTGDVAIVEEEGGGEEVASEEEEEEEEEEPASEKNEDEGRGNGEEKEEVSTFRFKRTKRRYLKLFRRQRSVNQCFCASNLGEALGDEGGDYKGFFAPKSCEVFGNEDGDQKSDDSSLWVNQEERLRILERLARLVEKGKFVCTPLKIQSRKLDRR